MPASIESHAEHGSDHPVSRDPTFADRAMRIVDYLFGVLYTLIGFEFVLEFLGARDGNAFKRMLDAMTYPFLHPFRTLLPTFSSGSSQMIGSYVVALVVYMTLQFGLRRLVRLAREVGPGNTD